MRPDRDGQWKDHVEGREKDITKRRIPELQGIKRSALAAESVTGDKYWDDLLSIVQARIDLLQVQLDAAIDPLKNSDVFDVEGIISQKLAVRLVGKEIETLQWLINLPKDLMEQGDHSRQLLESIDKTLN